MSKETFSAIFLNYSLLIIMRSCALEKYSCSLFWDLKLWALSWSLIHQPRTNRDETPEPGCWQKWSGFHSHFLSNFDRKKDYVRIRTIISSQKNMLRPPALSRSSGEKEKSLSVHLKFAAPFAAIQCSAGNGSEYCTVARTQLREVACLCA